MISANVTSLLTNNNAHEYKFIQLISVVHVKIVVTRIKKLVF